MELTRETARLMRKPFGVKCVTVVRKYEPNDLETVVGVFCRSVREVACRDYSTAQIAAWAPQPPDLSAWSARLGKGGVFVCERSEQIVGFARIVPKGSLICFTCIPSFSAKGWPVSCSLNSARGQSVEVSDIFGLR